MSEGDYLELMALYLLAHRMGEDVASSHTYMDRLQRIREANAPSAVAKAINSFHETRKAYDKSWKTTTCPSVPAVTQSVSSHNELKPQGRHARHAGKH